MSNSDERPTKLRLANSSLLESSLLEASARLEDIPVQLKHLWDPNNCPAHFLPWLAHGLSVDAWDSAWPEHIQRQVIAASVPNHRIKGTVGALKQSLNALDADLELQEWWQIGGPPHSARVLALAKNNLDEQGASFITPKLQAQLWQAIAANKPCRTQIDFHIGNIQQNNVYLAAAGQSTTLKTNHLAQSVDGELDTSDVMLQSVASTYEIGTGRLAQNADDQFDLSHITVQGAASNYEIGTEQLQQNADDQFDLSHITVQSAASNYAIGMAQLQQHADGDFALCQTYVANTTHTTTFQTSYMEIL